MALLCLALSASLWWTYFSDEEEAVERAMLEASPARRPQLALVGFGYWHYGLLLGIVAVAAGLKKAIGDPYEPLDTWIAVELTAGVALFMACEVGFRRALDIERSRSRLLAAGAAFLTLPLGTELSSAAQIGALAAIVAGALVAEGSRSAVARTR